MKVKDLITELCKYDDEIEVLVEDFINGEKWIELDYIQDRSHNDDPCLVLTAKY